MENLNRADFEKLVKEGISAIPEKFLRKLDNVAIVIEDEPTPAKKKKLNIHSGWTLLGLYEGVSQTRRGSNYKAEKTILNNIKHSLFSFFLVIKADFLFHI